MDSQSHLELSRARFLPHSRALSVSFALSLQLDMANHIKPAPCTTLQHPTAPCSTLQHTAAQCSTLQHTAAHCSTLQHTAAHCSTLQHTAAHCSTLQHTAAHRNTLQHTAAHRSTPQHTAAHCNTLQHTAAHCSTLHHTAAHSRLASNSQDGGHDIFRFFGFDARFEAGADPLSFPATTAHDPQPPIFRARFVAQVHFHGILRWRS